MRTRREHANSLALLVSVVLSNISMLSHPLLLAISSNLLITDVGVPSDTEIIARPQLRQGTNAYPENSSFDDGIDTKEDESPMKPGAEYVLIE